MLSASFVSLASAISLASFATAAPLRPTSTQQISKRQALTVDVVAFAQVQLAGQPILGTCLDVPVAADLGLDAVQQAVNLAATAAVTVGNVVDAQICAAVNNRQPTCNAATGGCGSGVCLDGFQEDPANPAGPCIPIVFTDTDALDATALVAVDVNLLDGVVGLSTQCIFVDIGADVGLTQIQNLVSAQAVVDLNANIANFDLCLAVNNFIPTCDAVNGCGISGTCIPGFQLENGVCVEIVVGPSQLARKRSLKSRRTLCPKANETACSISGGSAPLSNANIVAHDYVCHDLSSSIESCGVCGNVCSGANEGCFNGECVVL